LGVRDGERELTVGTVSDVSRASALTSVELFVGAGGLAMGTANAGFHHVAVIERDREACRTLRINKERQVEPISRWHLIQDDVKNLRFPLLSEDVDLVAGGPPCQPFSIGGKHGAYNDSRDMWSEAVRAVRELQPRAFVFENVRGLARPSLANYFHYIQLQLQHPELSRFRGEDWNSHLGRLERHHTNSIFDGLRYNLLYRVLNAADYGVPQKRERVIIVGFRSDLNVEWSFPEPTHSQDALLFDQHVTGEYWDRHGVSTIDRPGTPPSAVARITKLRHALPLLAELPWKTVRDAIGDLPDPELDGARCEIANHQYMPGAKPYCGHTGSPLDEPAKTLKAGDHGVPGGENMLVRPDGSVRYFTVRESARLQTFPDNFVFQSVWSESMRQLGNAVPVTLGEVVARSVAQALRNDTH
jgi:DNA (cytosine-5)-methyltransferase 1